MELKGSEQKGRHREVRSEGIDEQKYGPTTRAGLEAYGVGQAADDREAHIHQDAGVNRRFAYQKQLTIAGDLLHVRKRDRR